MFAWLARHELPGVLCVTAGVVIYTAAFFFLESVHQHEAQHLQDQLRESEQRGADLWRSRWEQLTPGEQAQIESDEAAQAAARLEGSRERRESVPQAGGP